MSAPDEVQRDREPESAQPPVSELLYQTTDPCEPPLIMPAWARRVPLLAERIDTGHAMRRDAGLPVDGSLPPGVEG